MRKGQYRIGGIRSWPDRNDVFSKDGFAAGLLRTGGRLHGEFRWADFRA